jgi:hypothetical protein
MKRWRRAVIGVAMTGVLAASGSMVLCPPGAGAAPPGVSSASMSADVSVSVVGGPQITATATGQINFTTSQLTVTANVPGTLKPILSLLPSSVGTLASGIGADTQVQVEVVGGTVYLGLPGVLSGKTWVGVTFPTAAVSKAFTRMAGYLGDAKSLLAEVEARHAKVSSLGRKDVDGAMDRGYRATVPVSTILGIIPGLGSLAGPAAGGVLGTSVPVIAWVNAKGEVAEITVSAGRPDASSGSIGSIDASVTFGDYGTAVPPVTAPAPTATITVSAAQLKSLAGPGAASKSASAATRGKHGRRK